MILHRRCQKAAGKTVLTFKTPSDRNKSDLFIDFKKCFSSYFEINCMFQMMPFLSIKYATLMSIPVVVTSPHMKKPGEGMTEREYVNVHMLPGMLIEILFA